MEIPLDEQAHLHRCPRMHQHQEKLVITILLLHLLRTAQRYHFGVNSELIPRGRSSNPNKPSEPPQWPPAIPKTDRKSPQTRTKWRSGRRMMTGIIGIRRSKTKNRIRLRRVDRQLLLKSISLRQPSLAVQGLVQGEFKILRCGSVFVLH